MDDIGVVVLAAGASSRLGKPKQLLEFQGKPLLQHVLDQIRPVSFASYVLVLGAGAGGIRNAIDPGNFDVAINENWTEGIAGSIRKGVEHSLAAHPDLDHLLFLLSDQPFVSNQLIRDLAHTHMQSGKKITACRYGGTTGVPAIFSKSVFPDLLSLRGDRGANRLIKQYRDEVAVVPFELGSIDVDTPEDYRELNRL